MGNARGTELSRHHKNRNANTAFFWEYSWQDIGQYDLPAFIDYILDETHFSQLTYVGFSQGMANAKYGRVCGNSLSFLINRDDGISGTHLNAARIQCKNQPSKPDGAGRSFEGFRRQVLPDHELALSAAEVALQWRAPIQDHVGARRVFEENRDSVQSHGFNEWGRM